jgi:small-conductance mechanosensitive channel
VRLWDKRRLVLPITYFLDKPFQNWTRGATELLGTVLLKVDFAIPVEAVRAELARICDADPLWDRLSCSLQVVELEAASVSLRAVVSASDASRLWDLRCNVRERLLAYLRSQGNGRYVARGRFAVEASAVETPNANANRP